MEPIVPPAKLDATVIPLVANEASPVSHCPSCKGKRLSATWEERKLEVDGTVFVGLSRVVLCKTCKHRLRDEKEVEAFAAAVMRVAAGAEAEGTSPHKVERQVQLLSGLWAFGPLSAASPRARMAR